MTRGVNRRVFFEAILCAVAMLALSGCRLLRPDDVVAEVGESRLSKTDVRNNSQPLRGADSIASVDNFIDQWVHKQVMLQEADKVLAADIPTIESMVEDYRTSLLNNRLNQQYLEGRIDTLITDSMVKSYFDRHRADFLIDRTIVRGRIVRLPATYRQSQKLFTLMGSKNEERQKDFDDTCAKNNFEVYTFDSWTDFTEFLSYLPVRRGTDYSYMLQRRDIQQMADADSKYFIEIESVLRRGEQAPLERVNDIVRRMIFSRRSAEIIRTYEDSLYQAALLDGKITIKKHND